MGINDNPQTFHPYIYAGNNPVLYIDASGRCWGPIEFLRDTAFYGQTCSNLDMAWTITTSPEASFGEKALATGYLITEGLAHTVAIGGSAVACLGGGCQAMAGTVGGMLSMDAFSIFGMTYLGLDAMFIALDLGLISQDLYLLWASGSCKDDELKSRLILDIVGLGLDIVAPGLGRGTSSGLKLAAQGGGAAMSAIEVARATAAVRGIQAVYKAGQVGVFIIAASAGGGSRGRAAGTGGPSPTSKRDFADDKLRQRHFRDHGSNVGAASEKEYLNLANKFFDQPSGGNLLEIIRSNGDVVRFNKITDEFGVLRKDGVIRTYFKPDPRIHGFPTNLDYFRAQYW